MSCHKKRPNTIPVPGLGKWLLGESRALKVGICCGLHHSPHFKRRRLTFVFQSGPIFDGQF
ncbi:hypothetical protein EFS38_09330 [Dickeya undicola]|uniref:Uncharacterized protein n=1 Tax=Dickeya undicola TaxID=1577887 RepID=A0ABX9WW95_9GAMM|nr:hypothetical protein EFS38_09330 [Dickeya undicola]